MGEMNPWKQQHTTDTPRWNLSAGAVQWPR